jgi:hypothetical protein
VADAVEDYSDMIAERATALGDTAEGTVHVAVERYDEAITSQSDEPGDPSPAPGSPAAGPLNRTGRIGGSGGQSLIG